MKIQQHCEGVSAVQAAEVVSRAAQSSKRELAARRKPEDWLQLAITDLTVLIQSEIRRNPTGWQFSEWRVSFVYDSKHGHPPLISQAPSGARHAA